MSILTDELKRTTSITQTENGANYYSTTDSSVLDFYSNLGSLRTVTDEIITDLFDKAYAEDKLLAMKCLFYGRDIRGGLGERRFFKTILKHLLSKDKDLLFKNLGCVFEYGRFDDVLELMDDEETFDILSASFHYQLLADNECMVNNKPVSLLAKWLPSINTKNNNGKRELAQKLAKKWGLSEKQYRQVLSKLRSYINIVEINMCKKDYDNIKYDEVPSKAMMKHRKAFVRNDTERFNDYIDSVSKGKTKINSSTIYPYEIFEKMGMRFCSVIGKDKVLEEQWKALPNYVDENTNVLVMADTSGSMNGRPMAIALSLAVYFAERNKGEFAGQFMTFSSTPSFVELKGETLSEKTRNVPNIISDTNLERALQLILDVAVNKGLKQEELPKSLLVISDMQFNYAITGRSTETFYESMKRMYEENGYTIPNIIFWNVDTIPIGFHAKQNTKGVQLVSGASPSIFKNVMDIIDKTPYEAMLIKLNDSRYDLIEV